MTTTLKAPAPHQKFDAAVSSRIEAMIGLDPRTTLDKLRGAQQVTSGLRKEEAKRMAELAQYEGRYGFPSHWEHERKALLARLANHRREELLRNGLKVTESYLEEYAHAHSEYRSFLELAARDRQKMEGLRAELADIRNQIDTAKALEVYYERHARLNDALVYHSGKELGL